MKHKWILYILIFTANLYTTHARDSFLSFHALPGGIIPLGQVADFYTFGGGVDLAAQFNLPFFPYLFLDGVLGYSFATLIDDTTLSSLQAGAGIGAEYRLGRVGFKGNAAGGIALTYEDLTAGATPELFWNAGGNELYAYGDVWDAPYLLLETNRSDR